ncbi:MAG: hypothetical protein NUW37_13735 [Planctomycetes bacterium]|nr:hypothetical protein [Planctomycetota bacterium]
MDFRKLPKLVLHYHFEGAIPWTLINEYLRAEKLAAETSDHPPWHFGDETRFSGFDAFRDIFQNYIHTTINSMERAEAAARATLEALARENVRYAEINWAPTFFWQRGLDYRDAYRIFEDLKSEFLETRGLHVRWFIGFARHRDACLALEHLETLLALGPVDGVDIQGDESQGRAGKFTQVYDVARDAGCFLKAHAGECDGPESVLEAVERLGVRRIGHGTRSAESEDAMDSLARLEVLVEVCPTSNFRIGVIESVRDHPLRMFRERGIKLHVNADDPMIFHNTVTSEHELLGRVFGYAAEDFAEMNLHALDQAILDDASKKKLAAEISSAPDGGTL